MKESINKLEGMMDTLMRTAEQVIVKYSEPVMSATLSVIQIEAIYYLVAHVVCIVALFVLSHKASKWYSNEKKKEKPQYEGFYSVLYAVTSLIGVMLLIALILCFPRILAAWDPKLYLLREVINKVV